MTTDYAPWIGRVSTTEDLITPTAMARFCATLDLSAGADVPQGFHWCLCTPAAATGALGVDGHPHHGEFLPPIALPRRMWAASTVDFLAPLMAGDEIRRRSTIATVEDKQGTSGRLVFVTIDHETWSAATLAVRERQTLVFRDRDGGRRPASPKAPDTSSWLWQRTVVPDTTLLFRYSALTFNSHRIHYDQPYATREEDYPGLVVHGPLMATLLLDLCARRLGPNALLRFSFRAKSPALVGLPLHLAGRQSGSAIVLAATTDNGELLMEANAAADELDRDR